MIIQIKGTSGAGKSTLVRKFMEQWGKKPIPGYIEGRRQPLYYNLISLGSKNVIVLGHYEAPTGGCDNIKSLDDIFELVEDFHRLGCHVIFEGLMITNDRNRIEALSVKYPGAVKLLCLNTPLEECKRSIEQRRLDAYNAKIAAGKNPAPLKPANHKNTEAKYNQFQRTLEICKSRKNLTVLEVDREQALIKLLQWTKN